VVSEVRSSLLPSRPGLGLNRDGIDAHQPGLGAPQIPAQPRLEIQVSTAHLGAATSVCRSHDHLTQMRDEVLDMKFQCTGRQTLLFLDSPGRLCGPGVRVPMRRRAGLR